MHPSYLHSEGSFIALLTAKSAVKITHLPADGPASFSFQLLHGDKAVAEAMPLLAERLEAPDFYHRALWSHPKRDLLCKVMAALDDAFPGTDAIRLQALDNELYERSEG